jgi:hypothetical protein
MSKLALDVQVPWKKVRGLVKYYSKHAKGPASYRRFLNKSLKKLALQSFGLNKSKFYTIKTYPDPHNLNIKLFERQPRTKKPRSYFGDPF